ncbi:MAG: glycoside hydrolase family 3 N-terminal domain-containing protein [Microbacterium sp.]|uniref:glycoside hydrolase family 3 N-terminal domain-containing protein n=1 Tax=Microbacterium sp. TaxID=51671 RepID=UPI0039E235A2
MRTRRLAPVIMVAALLLSGCVAEPAGAPTTATAVAPTPTATPTYDPIAGMTLAQRVGQLFMVGTPADGVDPTALAAVSEDAIGGIFLRGRSDAGSAATADLVAQFTAANPAGSPPLWVATDQEGGDVQVLSGPGFDDMPTALTQAQAGCDAVGAEAQRWGAPLAQAGVTMNLAPVADIVTSPDTERDNAPIGRLHRNYGYDEASVVDCAGSFATGMRTAGVLPTFKHFPGLGRTTANTDYSADVVDTEITASSPDVDAYRTLLAEGPAVVMVSTAVYQGIDPSAPAAFSSAVVTALLRDELGFDGVVMTDDLSATAQVAAWSPGDRAVLAVRAGVDLLLVSADAGVFPEMYDAVLQAAESDPAFAAQVDAAARRIVELKAEFP